MNDKEIQDILNNTPIKSLIDRIRKTQVWRRDMAGKRPEGNLTIDLWLQETGIAAGPYRTQAKIVYNHYKEHCLGKKLTENAIATIQRFGSYIADERVFPKHLDARRTFYHINKDIIPEAEREKQKAKKEQRKKKKASMGTQTPNL